MNRLDYTLPLEELPDPLPIAPLQKPFDVTIRPPGSKSITNRAYVLGALAKGESKIIRPLRSDDTDALLDALCTLGAVARWDGEDVFITGVNGRFPRGGHINLGDGGTPTRFMIACACLAAEPVVVDGSSRMRERPIAEGVEMLRELGAHIEYVEEEGRLPVRVTPSGDFKGGELTIGKTASSQFVSALMLIGGSLAGNLKITFEEPPTSFRYIELTWYLRAMWGARGSNEMHSEPDGRKLRGSLVIYESIPCEVDWPVEPDASSAVYWFFAAAMLRNSQMTVSNLTKDSLQPDAGLIHLLECWGPAVGTWFQHGLPAGTTVIGGDHLRIYDCLLGEAPDGALMVAGASSCAADPVVITGLHTLRVKETDRIAALANELTKVGCTVETTDDSITITPMPRELLSTPGDPRAEPGAMDAVEPVIIETYNDHRMAMAFAILGLVRPGISIRNPVCVAKSYPGFWRDFAKLYQ